MATVTTLSGKSWNASNVVVAMPPYISGQIQYDPPLFWKRQQLNQHNPMGTCVKALVEYPKRWWKTIHEMSNKKFSMLTECMDSTDPREENGDKAVMVCLIMA